MTPEPRGGIVAAAIVFMFFSGALGAGAGATSEGKASARAADIEPNNDWNSAVSIAAGEVVQGSIFMSSGGDNDDWYKLTVPYGQVVNASMYMVDYDTNDNGKYNFQLELYSSDNNQVDSSWTTYRWESTIAVQTWNQNPATVGIRIIANYTWGGGGPHYWTSAGRYNISANISLAQNHTGTSNGYLDGEKGPVGGAVFKLDPGPADNRLMNARLKSPSTGAFSVEAYDLWPITGSFYRQNASWVDQYSSSQEILFGGYNGTYFIIIKSIRGNGTFTLTTTDAGASRDDNNVPAKAFPVKKIAPYFDFVDQGVDWVDWYKVDAQAGRAIDSVLFMLDGGNFQINSTYRFTIFDQNFARIGNDHDLPYWTGGPNPSYITSAQVDNIQVGYNGPVYFTVRAISFNNDMSAAFKMARGWYSLTFTLPNDPPLANGSLPDVHMLEDTVDNSTVVSNYAWDPDGNNLAYSLFSGNYICRYEVNSTTGRVKITPRANWSGAERARLRATDDGPGSKYVEFFLNVTVEPVNDPPTVAGGLANITVLEENLAQTPDISDLFADIDDVKENFTYGLKLLGKTTHPPGATLGTSYDAKTHSYIMKPAIGFFGTFQYEISCTDGHVGTEPVTVRFNLTINHRNHDPVLRPGVINPIVLNIMEDETNSQLLISDYFTDIDMPLEYANDSLRYNCSYPPSTNPNSDPPHRVEFNLTADGHIVVNPGTEEYFPGPAYEEKLVLTATDLSRKSVSLNLTVRVTPINDPPVITSFQPNLTEVSMREGGKEIFRIYTDDVDSEETCVWYLDDARQGVTGSVFSFQPDYTWAGPHSLKVVVADEQTSLSNEWKILVEDVNRLPSVTILSPINGTKFVKGTTVTFRADGNDADDDTLTFIWRDDKGTELGRIQNLTINSLQPGTRIITLEANDGKGSSTQQVTVVITSPPANKPSGGFTPGFELAAALAAAFLCLAAGRAVRRRS